KQVTMTLSSQSAREVPVGSGFRIERTMRNIFRDADDRYPRIVRSRQSEREALADRIFVGPVTRGHSFINDRDRRRSEIEILRRQVATLRQCNAKCAQVI